MDELKKTLFRPAIDENKQHPRYRMLCSSAGSLPARWMLDNIYATFEDPDGNFLEQFQSTGFDTRYFELYLYAYFSRSGYGVMRPKPNPDFIVEKKGLRVAVEATTVNPATAGTVSAEGKAIKDLDEAGLNDYLRNELAIRFGSPLFSKLKKRYWESEATKNMPFVIAIEAFHDDESLTFGDAALARYVYGLDQSAGSWDATGALNISSTQVTEHKIGAKAIPSSFFAQPEAENISAILFTNSGTNAKFGRMGYQHGAGNETISVWRHGFAYEPDPDAMDPTYFAYDMDTPPFVESWGQGLVVLHNPRARHPIPYGFFLGAAESALENGMITTQFRGWHPIASKTVFAEMGEAKAKLAELPFRMSPVEIHAITKQEFERIIGVDEDDGFIASGWFCDGSRSFYGTVMNKVNDGDWGYFVYACDVNAQFQLIIATKIGRSRQQARMELQLVIAKLLASPKRYFGRHA